MTIRAEVEGVGILEFPDGTSPEVIKATVRRVVSGQHRPADPTEGMSGYDKFMAGAGKSFYDLARGAGQLIGAVSQEDVDDAAKRDRPLMKTGAGVAGNITGSVVSALPLAAIPGANTVAGAGAVGGVLGALQPVESGDSRLVNAGRGALFSAAVPAAVAGGKAIKAATDPLRSGGQEAIVRNTLQRFAHDPEQAARALSNPVEFVPGSKPTVAEASLDPGLAVLQRGAMSADPQIAAQFAQREATNQGARMSALNAIAKDDAAMEAAKSARSAASDPLYAAAKDFRVRANETLKYLLDRPSMKDAWARAQKLAQESGETLTIGLDAPASKATTGILDAAGREITRDIPEQAKQYSGRALHYMKMALDDMADPNVVGSIGKHEQAAIGKTRNMLLNWMDQNIPDYGAARKAFAEGSKPISQMEVGRYLTEKMRPALGDYGDVPRVRAEAYAGALRNAEQTTRNATGFQSGALEKVMTPEQMGSLEGIAKDLARRAAAQEVGKVSGSPTAQYLSSQNLMRQVAGPLGIPESWAESTALSTMARPLDWAMKRADPVIQQKLAETLLDPEKAARLLQIAIRSDPALLRVLSQYLPVSAGAGLLSQAQ